MKTTDSRRSFLKKIGAGGVILPAAVLNDEAEAKAVADSRKNKAEENQPKRDYNAAYKENFLNRVAFPIGGLGAGMFCLEGSGAISHMSIRSKPDVFNEPGLFGAISVKELKNGAKIIEGVVPDWKRFGQPNTGNGAGGSIFGLPRFESATFLTRFPFATISLEEKNYPLQAEITGWSPFIPTDADNSSLPSGALEYKFKNTSNQPISCVFSFHGKNFMRPKEPDKDASKNGKNSIRPITKGFILSQAGSETRPHDQGDFAIFTDSPDTVVDHCWFRGGWFDPLTMTWETIRKGEFKKVDPVDSGAPGASLYVPFNLKPGAEKIIKLMMTWYVPVSDIRHGGEAKEDEKCDGNSGCCATSDQMGTPIADEAYTTGKYKPWYTSKFKDVSEASDYWSKNYETFTISLSCSPILSTIIHYLLK